MVDLTALWLPIVLSAVIVFVASSLLHMVLQLHKGDYQKLPDEDKLMEAMRNAGVGPGNYHFPHCAGPAEMKKPEMMEKIQKGPVGLLNIIPNGPPNMGKYLGMWFLFCLFISVFAAYLAGRTLPMGSQYLAVFRVAGAVAFLGYSGSQISDSIWKAQRWSTTARHLFDGLLYGMFTGGTFGWLWPR